jgi:hypothetical protein
MRRAFVIFLVLLFPLNVFALSLPAPLIQAGFAPAPAVASVIDAQAAEGSPCALACNTDPDQPSGHQDLLDIVHCRPTPGQSGPARRAALGHDAGRRFDCRPPPVKPPRP